MAFGIDIRKGSKENELQENRQMPSDGGVLLSAQIHAWGEINSTTKMLVPRAGVEPARPLGTTDFKSVCNYPT